LIFGVHPIWKPTTGLPCLQIGFVSAFLEAFPAGSKAYFGVFRAVTDGGLWRLGACRAH